MKFFELLERALPTLQQIIPKRMLWSIILFHYGLQVLIVIIYLVDWIFTHGNRTELLKLLEVL